MVFVLSVAALLITGGCGTIDGELYETPTTPIDELPPSKLVDPKKVVRVFDGDTLVVDLDGVEEKVRFMGIDAPELYTTPPEAFAQEARDYVFNNVGTHVDLVFDSDCASDPMTLCRDTTPSKRLLAYVRLSDGTDLGARLVERGLAEVYIYQNQQFDKRGEYESLQAAAQSAGLGMW